MVSLRTRNRLTRLGYHFAFVGTFAAMGGSIRGLNLLLVLAGLSAALLLVQWRVCRRMGETLLSDRHAPEIAFAGEPFTVVHRIFNTSRFTTARRIRLCDHVSIDSGAICDGSAGRLPSGYGNARPPRSPRQCEIVIPVERIAPADCRRIASKVVIRHRGRYRLEGLELSTTFPLSLMTATSRSVPPSSRPDAARDAARDDSGTLWVTPRRVPLRSDWARRLVSGEFARRGRTRHGAHADGEFHGLREWQRGDTLRQIHWRTFARIGRPAVRQTLPLGGIEFSLVIDAFLPEGPGAKDLDALEKVLSVAITMVSGSAAGKRVCAGVVVAGRSSEEPASAGESFLRGRTECAKRLAVECGAFNANLPVALRTAAESASTTCQPVVISTRTADDAGFGPAGVTASRNRSRGPRPGRKRTPNRQPYWLSTTDGSIDRLLVVAATPQPDKQAGVQAPTTDRITGEIL